jgi:hypothetical protein
MDSPRSTVRAAALGRVEVSGKVLGPYTLVAPLSHTDCFYYRLVIESNPQGDLRERIQEACAPLFLDDGTGTLMIYPQGSELQLPPSSARSEYGKLALALTSFSEGPPEFAQEYCIKPGDTIFVLGTLRENPWAKKDPIAESNELSRIGPGFVGESESAASPGVSIFESQASRGRDFGFAEPVRLSSSGDPDARRGPVFHLH